MLEKINDTMRNPIKTILYFNILCAITNLESPSTLSTNIIMNIINNPLEAPLISAELSDIWDEMHIAKNKNNMKYGLVKLLAEKIICIKST